MIPSFKFLSKSTLLSLFQKKPGYHESQPVMSQDKTQTPKYNITYPSYGHSTQVELFNQAGERIISNLVDEAMVDYAIID